ncbi:hypothetical protein [Bradyrhizobium cytisi]|uniref:hypothetical protein n=1 Tax=Bradyrhizobium cytisi TaxID=515489 RepID=UPI001652DA92|nr:hypothetical protein [Bradyrhizobium cytisi]
MMRFDGREGSESVGPTMPLLASKGYRSTGRALWVGANAGEFTPQANQIPAI